jgi:hypothetical protein
LQKLQHPASLNALQQYRQASRILKRSSRASNPAWYQDATALEHQLHIRCDGTSIASYFLVKSAHAWSEGPPVTEAILREPDKAVAFARDLMAAARAKGIKALGIVIHIANEFAITELKSGFTNIALLDELKASAVSDPASIFDDSSVPVEQASWRILPYLAEGSESIATAITISRQLATFLDVVRETGESLNFPLITRALSAPLVALTALGTLASPTEGKPFLGIFQYPSFTVVGFFDAKGELKLVRTMQHHGRKRVTKFRHAISTANISLEFIDPDVFVMPLGADVDDMIGPDLQLSMPDSRVEVLDSPQDRGSLPAWCVEPWFAANAGDRPVRIHSNTYTLLHEKHWGMQDFLPVPQEVAELFPTRFEIRLLRFSKLVRVAMFLVAIGAIGWLGFNLANAMRQEEWAADPAEATRIKTRLNMLTQERARADHWHNLLADRSKAWLTLEDLALMFPEESGVRVKSLQYSAKPETSPGRANSGFIREWRISGLTDNTGSERLNSLNTRDGIANHFAQVAKHTGNATYNSDLETRTLNVTVSTRENRQYRAPTDADLAARVDSIYPSTFDLVITQSFDSNDPLALKASAAP